MTWRLAYSLEVLRDECDALAPKRSKVNDGTIGDAAHQARPSRHNPNRYGVVTALDITHDPQNGMDTYALFDYLAAHPHICLQYVVSNRRIAHRDEGWRVRAYRGSNPHLGHIHVAVGRGPDSDPTGPYDIRTPWGVYPPREEDELTDEERRTLEEIRTLMREIHAWTKDLRWTGMSTDSFRVAIANALAIHDYQKAKELNDKFYARWPDGDTGLPKGWVPSTL